MRRILIVWRLIHAKDFTALSRVLVIGYSCDSLDILQGALYDRHLAGIKQLINGIINFYISRVLHELIYVHNIFCRRSKTSRDAQIDVHNTHFWNVWNSRSNDTKESLTEKNYFFLENIVFVTWDLRQRKKSDVRLNYVCYWVIEGARRANARTNNYGLHCTFRKMDGGAPIFLQICETGRENQTWNYEVEPHGSSLRRWKIWSSLNQLVNK